jgi:putative cell wall-binding protein
MNQKLPINANTFGSIPKAEELAFRANAGLAIAVLALLVAAFSGCGGSGETANRGAKEMSEAAETASAGGIARISGGDPATLAANIAFAVYPGHTPAQRPKSITLVAEDSWQNAVAAGVFMAHPLRAPLLISSAGGMPEPTTAAVELFQPQGNLLAPSGNASRKGAAFFATGTVATPYQGLTSRMGETSGAVQAASIEAYRKTLFREAPKRVIVASENDPAFALPAAAWAAYSGDPILYSRRDELPRATIEALKRFPANAYVLGPASVISPSAVAEIRRLTRGVKRISGKTPAENAVAFARYSDSGFGWNANGPGHGFVIARSNAPLEAALASPLSASGMQGPLLLAESAGRLPDSVREYLLDIKPLKHVWIVGDEEAIAPSQQAEIEELTDANKR